MILDLQNVDKYFWGSNCETAILSNEKTLSVKFETMPPNTKEQIHFHKLTTQLFFILEGTASFSKSNKVFNLTKQQSILIKPNIQHCIKNESDQNLIFLVISDRYNSLDRYNLGV